MTARFTVAYLDEHREAIPALAQLHYDEWHAITPGVTIADRIRAFEGRARRGEIPMAVVAVAKGAVIGVASLLTADIESHAHLTPWLGTVMVDPRWRGHGVGSALVERIADEARALAVRELFLFTYDQQALYARLGWEVLERTTYVGRPGDVMVRRLG